MTPWQFIRRHGGLGRRVGYGLVLAVALMCLAPATEARPARPTATKPAEARPAADDKDRLTKPHTFNTWQPKQRDRDLGKEDDGD